MYTFWKRSAPPASMDIFNAPTREICTVRRERTNTPLQALVTLNDPQFVEAARYWPEAALKNTIGRRRARSTSSRPCAGAAARRERAGDREDPLRHDFCELLRAIPTTRRSCWPSASASRDPARWPPADWRR